MHAVAPRAILLDLDDTILAFAQVADPTWRQVCERFAPRIEGISPEELFEAIKQRRAWYWEDPGRHRRGRLRLSRARREIVSAALSELGVQSQPMANEIADTFDMEREKAIRPLPGAIEALRRLREREIRLALVTNGNANDQRRKIERFGLGVLFDCILIEGEFGAGKPEARVYAHVLEQLGVQPEEAWMVGDNLEWDVGGPQRLGISGIWLDLKGQGLPAGSEVQPDRIIRSLTELVWLAVHP